MQTLLSLPALAVVVGVLVLAGLVIWSIKRHRDPVLAVDGDGPVESLLPSLAGLSLGTVLTGNRVEVIENGTYFDALLAAVAGARRSVHFETFLWKEGAIGQRVAEALAGRARAGVKVRVLLDAIGTRRMGTPALALMEAAGCRVVRFHPWRLEHFGVMNERDHRKLAVIDGRIAFVGGHCIVDHWLGDARSAEEYADISLRLEGPIVHSVQAAFGENWVGHTGELFTGEAVFPVLAPAGTVAIHAAFLKPEGSAPAVKLLHHAAICCARQRLWIQNPYFVPEPKAIDALAAAVRRGVDVRVLMPAVGGSDNPLVAHAAHRNFERLLRGGVRLFEYPHTLLHQKVMTVDRCFSAIGSSNFDDRSFETNEEITLGVLDEATAARLDAVFEKYAARSREITPARWRERGLGHRLVDNAAYLFNEVL